MPPAHIAPAPLLVADLRKHGEGPETHGFVQSHTGRIREIDGPIGVAESLQAQQGQQRRIERPTDARSVLPGAT